MSEVQESWCQEVYGDPTGRTDAEIALAFSILAQSGIDTWARVVYNDENSSLDSVHIAKELITK